jgi:predicted nucleic acid-binding protein
VILYLDTSAILKRYFQESFSEEVSAKWKQSEMIVTSSVAYAETMATISRKQKEADIDNKLIQKTIQAFQMDWSGFIRVEVTDDLNEYINNVLQKHPLRGFDAIHLASALVIYEKFPRTFFFACFDQRLNQAARLESLPSF